MKKMILITASVLSTGNMYCMDDTKRNTDLFPDFFYCPSDFGEPVMIKPPLLTYSSGGYFITDYGLPSSISYKARTIIFEIYSRALKTASTLAKLQNAYQYISASTEGLTLVEKGKLAAVHQEKYKTFLQQVGIEIDDLD